MSQGKAKAFIQEASLTAYNKLMDEWDELQANNQKATDDAFWGGLIGSIGLPLFIGLGGPMSAGVAAMLSGAGSYFGQEIGSRNRVKEGFQGGEAIESQGFRSDIHRELVSDADVLDENFDSQVLSNAINAASSTYFAAGGNIPGTKGWKEAGGISGVFDATKNPAFGGFDVGDFLYENIGAPISEYFNPAEAIQDIIPTDIDPEAFYMRPQ